MQDAAAVALHWCYTAAGSQLILQQAIPKPFSVKLLSTSSEATEIAHAGKLTHSKEWRSTYRKMDLKDLR